jgi:hypothetical protein
MGIVKIARDDTRAEPKAAHRVRKEHREIPTRFPANVQADSPPLRHTFFMSDEFFRKSMKARTV